MNIHLKQEVKTKYGIVELTISVESDQAIADIRLGDRFVSELRQAYDATLPNKPQIQGLKKKALEAIEREENIRRRLKLCALRTTGIAYPNTFKPQNNCAEIYSNWSELDGEELEKKNITVSIAGRLFGQRVMGKAAFAELRDYHKNIQLYLNRDNLPQEQYSTFKQMDIGDIIGVEGTLFRTETGMLSISITHIELLAKALNPLPDKYHGLQDIEQRYRQRYVDLIVNDKAAMVFKKRSEIIMFIRNYFIGRDYLEVETPMMHSILGGAAAKPFTTHHNALDMDLYLRIAPELYLKRLIVGGFNRVFEINRNFRNEGLSTKHNPEFTMLEFYQAYATYEDFMELTENLFRALANNIFNCQQIVWQEHVLDFSKPFKKISMRDAIIENYTELNKDNVDDRSELIQVMNSYKLATKEEWGVGKLQTELFEARVEEQLLQPTFITQYPIEISPLSRRNDKESNITDRFELFIGGREIANGFSELNDPEDQSQRFKEQVESKKSGDDEAMEYDSDYINALEYGMPPTAGEGIGIDRLVMLFTDTASIRDVLLFPLMRPSG